MRVSARFLAVAMLQSLVVVALMASAGIAEASTRVPGHNGPAYDADENGYPDAGVVVNGKYTSVFAYEGAYGTGAYPEENWYWDLGDGRENGTVGSIAQLDQSRLTVCNYQVQYRGSFENDAYQDTGWIMNNINCSGFDDNNSYTYLMVHRSDPRFTGEGLDAGWGPDWEYFVLTQSGQGNLARPESHVGS